MTNEQMVLSFHKKYGFECGKPVTAHNVGTESLDKINNGRLRGLASVLHQLAVGLKEEAIDNQANGDDRLYRAWLNVEELSEKLTALAKRDQVLLADAIADMEYINMGDAVAFGIPAQECFNEVHLSNMTKRRSPEDPRMRDKSHSGYRSPDIAGVLRRHDSREA